MNRNVQAINCMFEVNLGDGWISVGCAKQFNITVTTQTKAITTVGNGAWSAVDYDRLSYTVSLDSLLAIPRDDSSIPGIFDFASLQKAFLSVKFRALYYDDDRKLRVVRGTVIITSSTFNAAPPELANGSVSMQGTGELFYDDTLEICDAEFITEVDESQIGSRTKVQVTYTGTPTQIKYQLDGGSYIFVTATTSPMTINLPNDLYVGLHYLNLACVCGIYTGDTFMTSFTVVERNSGTYILGSSTGSICSGTPLTLYSDIPYQTGANMFTDSTLVTPASGHAYIVGLDNNIFSISTGGTVGTDTTLDCTIGTPFSMQLGTSSTNVCTNASSIVYINAPFNPGVILYTDVHCTTPYTGFTYVMYPDFSSAIYNLNTSTGALGTDTGLECTPPPPSSYDLIIDKEVANDHITVLVTDTTAGGSGTSYDFNEAGHEKTFSGVFLSSDVYTVTVTVTPAIVHMTCPISISWATGSHSTPSGTTLTATGIVSDLSGVVVSVDL